MLEGNRGNGGGAGNAGGRGGDGGRDDDDDGNAESVDVAATLAKAGLKAEGLPNDLMAALKAGRIGASELANWQAVTANPLTRLLAMSAYIRARLLASPTLPRVLGIEVGVGCLTTLAAESAARGERFGKELDFVLANQLLIMITNMALVLALAPAAAIGAKPAAGTLGGLAASMPAFALQQGAFSVPQRVGCLLLKASRFAFIGAMTSAVGQVATAGLINIRSQFDPRGGPGVVLADALPSAAAYAVYMASSSNARYQVVSSLEARLVLGLPGGAPVHALTSSALRTYNRCVPMSSHAPLRARHECALASLCAREPDEPASCRPLLSLQCAALHSYLGSANWAWWARYRGVQ